MTGKQVRQNQRGMQSKKNRQVQQRMQQDKQNQQEKADRQKQLDKNRQIQEFLDQGEIIKAWEMLLSLEKMDVPLLILKNLIHVFCVETEQNAEYAIFDYSTDIDKLSQHFIRLKLLMRRLEFNLPEQYQEEFYVYCNTHHVSEYLLDFILLTNIFNKEQVCRKLMDRYPDKADYFARTCQYAKEAEHGKS